VLYLSEEWFTAVERALSGVHPGLEGRLVLRQEVDGAPSHSLALADGRAELHRGASGPPPDVTMSCDRATALQLAEGALSVPAAILSGRLVVEGDVARLVDVTDALAVVAEAVRGTTAAAAAGPASGPEDERA